MTAIVVLKKASRAVWLKHRSRGLGGTDVAAVLGANPWRTPLEVFLDKTQPQPDNMRDNWAMRRGRHLERLLVDEYARRHPGAILDKPPALLAHPEHPWLRASLDHLAHHPDLGTVVVEVKTCGLRAAPDWWGGAIPDHYAIQVLTYLCVTGLDEAHVIADVAGDVEERVIYRDPVWEAAAIPILAEFWDHVQAGTPVDVDYAHDRIPTLNRVWEPVPGSARDATTHELDIVARLQLLDQRLKPLTTRKEQLRVELRTAMGTDQTLTDTDGRKAAWLDARGTLRTAQPTEENNA